MWGHGTREKNVVREYIRALNTRDLTATRRIYGEECRLIDSQGGSISGHDNCVEATRRFFALPITFSLEAHSLSERHGEILVSGKVDSSEASLGNDRLWRVRLEGKRIVEWQSYADGPAFPGATRLMPESAVQG